MGDGCVTSSLDLSLSCYDHDRDRANRRRSGRMLMSDHHDSDDGLWCLSLGISNSAPLFSHSLMKEADKVEEIEAMEEDVGPRKKLKLSAQQISVLEEYFRANNTLNGKQKQDLGNKLKLRPRQVEVWFQNRRARTKLKQMEADCELLRKCCKTLEEENTVLKWELQRLRDRGSDSSTAICPRCEISRA